MPGEERGQVRQNPGCHFSFHYTLPSSTLTEKWFYKVHDDQSHDQMSFSDAMNAGCLDISAEDCQGWIRHAKRFFPRWKRGHKVWHVWEFVATCRRQSWLTLLYICRYPVHICIVNLYTFVLRNYLKGLYVTSRNCLLTMAPVAVKSTAVSILLFSFCGSEPASAKTVVWHTWDMWRVAFQ